MSDLDDLKRAWTLSPRPTVKLAHYFPIYAQLFGHLRGTKCTFVETGILDGGSLFMWREWLGPDARIIGIDMNPAAARWRGHGFEILIGDQGDPAFWVEAIPKIGDFDVFLDDGGHQSFQQIVTATAAITAAAKPCLVVVEDTATSFMRDFSRHGRHTFLEFAKAMSDLLLAPLALGESRPRFPERLNEAAAIRYANVKSIEFFCGVVAFKCEPGSTPDTRVIRNRDADEGIDFRYDGVDHATVMWPDLLVGGEVMVRGGANANAKRKATEDRLRAIGTNVKRGDLRSAARGVAELVGKVVSSLTRR